MVKLKEKQKAIRLRKRGYSYSEILKQVPVAKSTLSLWLRSVGLSKRQKQRLTEKKLAAAYRGAADRRSHREYITKEIKEKAKREIGKIDKRELWMIGIALYWAEGAKEKEYRPGARVSFSNSDPKMVKIFLKWLGKCCKISRKEIIFRIYLHETAEKRKTKIQKYWSKVTDLPLKCFQKISWKRSKISTKRKNIGKDYHGLLQIKIKKSVNLNRKIAGWIEGICGNCGVV